MDRILLGHGSGGKLMHELIREHFSPAFGIEEAGDSAIVNLPSQRLAYTTDSWSGAFSRSCRTMISRHWCASRAAGILLRHAGS